jgi:hypothetical protein
MLVIELHLIVNIHVQSDIVSTGLTEQDRAHFEVAETKQGHSRRFAVMTVLVTNVKHSRCVSAEDAEL